MTDEAKPDRKMKLWKLCTCYTEPVNSASIDPPDLILDPWCPVHGYKDPDVEYERQRDDATWDTTYERDMDFDD